MVLGAFATREILLLPLDIYWTLINGVPPNENYQNLA